MGVVRYHVTHNTLKKEHLLPRHCQAQAFLRADPVTIIIFAIVDLDPADLAVELAGPGG